MLNFYCRISESNSSTSKISWRPVDSVKSKSCHVLLYLHLTLIQLKSVTASRRRHIATRLFMSLFLSSLAHLLIPSLRKLDHRSWGQLMWHIELAHRHKICPKFTMLLRSRFRHKNLLRDTLYMCLFTCVLTSMQNFWANRPLWGRDLKGGQIDPPGTCSHKAQLE